MRLNKFNYKSFAEILSEQKDFANMDSFSELVVVVFYIINIMRHAMKPQMGCIEYKKTLSKRHP
jgi:hypothetical protein